MDGGDPVPPVEFSRELRLADGRVVAVQPLTPADAPELGEAISQADPETLYRRFCGPPPRVTPRLLRRLTELDYERRFALVARDALTGRGVAIARYEGTAEPDVADVAVVVDPKWRRVGLATALIMMLADAARASGIRLFSATYLPTNRPVAELLDDVGGKSVIANGLAEGIVRLGLTEPKERATEPAPAGPAPPPPDGCGPAPPPPDGGPPGREPS